MTASSITASSAGAVPHHGHHRHSAGSAQDDSSQDFGSLSDVLGAGGAGSGSPAPAGPSTGPQGFASQLQSILLSAQPGAASPATAAADPTSTTDPASPLSGPISHLADRLQSLLGQSLAGAAGAAATNATQPAQSLQSVLDNLQQTLQQSLAAYQTPTGSTASTLLTA